MKKIFCITVIIFLCNTLVAQTNSLGTWNILNISYKYSNRLSFFAETQLRSLKFYNNFHYYEYKGGANYAAHKNLKLSLGAGSYQTYKEGGNFLIPKNNNEFRLWPQATLYQTIGKFNIEQRYRAELRFTSAGYRNRFRYRFALAYHFGKERNKYKPFQVSASNELFFTNRATYFERNRILLACNYKPSKATTIQLGYLRQFDYKINDEIGRDFFQIGYFLEFYRRLNTNNISSIELKDN